MLNSISIPPVSAGAKKSMKHLLTGILLLLVTSSSLHASSKPGQSGIPNVDLQVAARRTSGDSPKNGIYMFHLHCGLGQCSLQLLTLNECERTDGGEPAFSPKVLSWASWAGNLQVKMVAKDTLAVTVFQGSHHAEPAYLKFNYVDGKPLPRRVKAFEAKGFIDYHSPKSGNELGLVPLIGRSVRIPLDCPVLLPGVEE